MTTAPPDGDRDGTTYAPAFDRDRLNRQARLVYDVMADGQWHTLGTIARLTHQPEASVSARLRDLRKPRFGGLTVERERGLHGLHVYRLVQPEVTA